MEQKLQYKRHYIFLEEYYKGLGMSSSKPSGFAKIELKDTRITLELGIKGLKKPDISKERYIGIMVLNDKIHENTVVLGDVSLDDQGSGKLNAGLSASELFQRGAGPEDIVGVAVVLNSIEWDWHQKLTMPLVGMITKTKADIKKLIHVPQKQSKPMEDDYVQQDNQNIQEQPSVEIQPFEDKKFIIEEQPPLEQQPYQYKQPPVEEIEKPDEIFDQTDNINYQCPEQEYNYNDENYDNECQQEVTPWQGDNWDPGQDHNQNDYIEEEVQEVEEDDYDSQEETEYNQQPQQYQQQQSSQYTNSYWNQANQYLYSTLSAFQQVQPLEKQFPGYRWWNIDNANRSYLRSYLPFYGYINPVYHQSASYSNEYTQLIEKYGHHIFGIVDDVDRSIKYYVYGIPGVFLSREQPYGGSTGFVTWCPDNQGQGLGYWLVHIETKTGKVVAPLEITMPIS